MFGACRTFAILCVLENHVHSLVMRYHYIINFFIALHKTASVDLWELGAMITLYSDDVLGLSSCIT